MRPHRWLTWNKTLRVWSWNLPAGETCPGQTSWCRTRCYARHNYFTLGLVRKAHQERLSFSKTRSFIPTLVSECQEAKLVRIHSSGDFYSHNYMAAWDEIIHQCPDTTFFCYTRTWRAAEELVDILEYFNKTHSNLFLWLSMDPATQHEQLPSWANRIAYIEMPLWTGYANCLKQTQPGESCRTCGKCFNKFSKKIVFRQH